MSRRAAPQHSFTLIEPLIVIIVILASIAIPASAAQRDKAKEAVLRLNARSIAIASQSYVADGLTTSWLTSYAQTNGTLSSKAATHVSCALEENVKQGGAAGTNAEGYRNPYSGKTAILNQTSLPTSTDARPAVWVTQQGTYRYSNFPTTTNTDTRTNLAGTVVACWNTTTNRIEIFFVKKNGQKSAACTYIKM